MLSLGIISCGKERKNFIAKSYHNTTTYFNYYYNANVKYKEGVKEIDAAFTIPLEGNVPLMYFGDKDTPKQKGEHFNVIIKKCETALFKHPNTKWKDDCYLLMGKCYFYKQEYVTSRDYFQYIIDEYPKSKLIPDAYLWLLKALYMNGNISTADQLMEKELPKLKLKKRHKGELAIVKATMHIAKGSKDDAIKSLESDIKSFKGKLNRARVHFLLGQLYAEEGKFSKAYEHYKKVTKINVDYAIVFAAKMKIARLYADRDDQNLDTRKVMKLLKRMLRDEKNIEYKDQIYYEMALIAIRDKKQEEAISLLQSSIKHNTSNQRQKALSYYKIGQIYFYEKQDYTMAQAYYDSAATSITQDSPEYDEITKINKTLKEYIGYVNTIAYQDSMIGLAKLPDAELDALIDDIIAEEKRKEEERQREMEEQMENMQNQNMFDQFGGSGGKKGYKGWYFDNPDVVSQGKMDFQRIWGNRKNEDHWRRKNKTLVTIAENEGSEEEVDPMLDSLYGDKAKYYKDIPKTPEALERAHDLVASSLYGLGQVYKDKLNEPLKAINTFQKLVDRYPESPYTPKAYYGIFKVYQKEDPPKADNVKRIICEKYPISVYCKLANNENVGEGIAGQDKEFKTAYNALYVTFTNKDYETCISLCDFMISKFGSVGEISKVYWIKAQSLGFTKKIEQMKEILILLRDNFPDADVTPYAIERLKKMSGGDEVSSGGDGQDTESGGGDPGKDRFRGFTNKTKPGERYYVLIFVSKESIPSNDLKIRVKEFNTKYFSDKGLSSSIFFYQKTHHIAYISQFKDALDALDYIDFAQKQPQMQELVQKTGDRFIFITPNNFKTAYGQKRFADYFLFFDQEIMPGINK